MELTVVIAVCGCAVSLATFFIGRTSAAKERGTADGELKSDIRHIKESLEKQDAKFDKQDVKLDGIISSYEDVKVELEKVKGRVSTIEQKMRMLHGE